jgi:hypothetical protein
MEVLQLLDLQLGSTAKLLAKPKYDTWRSPQAGGGDKKGRRDPGTTNRTKQTQPRGRHSPDLWSARARFHYHDSIHVPRYYWQADADPFIIIELKKSMGFNLPAPWYGILKN